MIERVCLRCGVTYKVYPSEPTKYCSVPCIPRSGPDHHGWIDGRSYANNTYVTVWQPGHPRASSNRVGEHILVAEQALGYYLDRKHIVHHHDEDRSNNRNDNLVVCESQAYHTLLHMRAKVLRNGGDPNTQKICSYCHTLRLKRDFYAASRGEDHLGRACRVCTRERKRRAKR